MGGTAGPRRTRKTEERRGKLKKKGVCVFGNPAVTKKPNTLLFTLDELVLSYDAAKLR